MSEEITLALSQHLAIAAASCYLADTAPEWENDNKTCHVYSSLIDGVPCYAFEGTTDVSEWMVNFTCDEMTSTEHPRLGPVHAGFLNNVLEAVEYIMTDLAAREWSEFYLCGHSKGAGEAVLAHALLKDNLHEPLKTYAFEPPRVGTHILRHFIGAERLTYTQTHNVSGVDLVTCVANFLGYGPVDSLETIVVPDDLDEIAKHKMPAILAAYGLPAMEI